VSPGSGLPSLIGDLSGRRVRQAAVDRMVAPVVGVCRVAKKSTARTTWSAVMRAAPTLDHSARSAPVAPRAAAAASATARGPARGANDRSKLA